MGVAFASPCAVDARWLCLIESGLFASWIEAYDQRADAEWPHTSALSVSLLYACYVFGNVLDREGIFHRQTMALGFEASFVDQDSCIGVKTCESEADVCVHH